MRIHPNNINGDYGNEIPHDSMPKITKTQRQGSRAAADHLGTLIRKMHQLQSWNYI